MKCLTLREILYTVGLMLLFTLAVLVIFSVEILILTL
ncbi:hypothetical protein Theam_1756 (plasmid) [Thermovibrio ammonificans HB-1]|uniref:Uncharacterized protein n=1 Tax=Thermovibrio ammonificans (strain DSM 15698 / JCM 12110 / HB-1) TaxID=648996 RepID=E8T6Z1_THEA1|nr:hypothetical protein Theam_1756 [Thermovibrio ammonificans HB-1]